MASLSHISLFLLSLIVPLQSLPVSGGDYSPIYAEPTYPFTSSLEPTNYYSVQPTYYPISAANDGYDENSNDGYNPESSNGNDYSDENSYAPPSNRYEPSPPPPIPEPIYQSNYVEIPSPQPSAYYPTTVSPAYGNGYLKPKYDKYLPTAKYEIYKAYVRKYKEPEPKFNRYDRKMDYNGKKKYKFNRRSQPNPMKGRK